MDNLPSQLENHSSAVNSIEVKQKLFNETNLNDYAEQIYALCKIIDRLSKLDLKDSFYQKWALVELGAATSLVGLIRGTFSQAQIDEYNRSILEPFTPVKF